MNKPKIFLMVGLSASGKSTIAKELAEKYSCVIVSSDNIRGEMCEGGVIDQSQNEEVFKEFHSRIKQNLKSGINVIADATNITMKARRSIIQNICKIDCEKIAYIIPKKVEKCLEDNIYKEYPVPHHVIQKQMMNFQIPFYEEGFDEIAIHKFNDEYVNEVFMADIVNKMCGFNQKNPHHTMTLDDHCDFTFEEFSKKKYPIEFNIAARIHDVGKLFTQKFDDQSVAHYYQHENVGCYYLLSNMDNVIDNMSISVSEFINLLFLVNYHMMPMNWQNEKTKNSWNKRFGDAKYQMLLDFNECDKVR